MKVLILNGPNLNLLGERSPEIYGYTNFADYLDELADRFPSVRFQYYQSNVEGELIDAIHAAGSVSPNLNPDAEARTTVVSPCDAIVLNAGALTHYSYALTDAIEAVSVPVIEVHISNIAARERFRANSVIAPVCMGSISGFGMESYALAIHALLNDVSS